MSNWRNNDGSARLWRRFRDAHDGVAAVEFAVILPFLFLAYLGMVDVAQLVMTNRKVTQLTSTLSDLTARLQSAPLTEIDNIFGAARTVLLPYDWRKATMTISSVIVDSAGVGRICWSSSYPPNASKPARGTTVVLPDSAKVPNTSVIMASANYRFSPMLTELFGTAVTLGDSPIFTRPRNGKPDGTDSVEQIVRSDVKGCPTY